MISYDEVQEQAAELEAKGHNALAAQLRYEYKDLIDPRHIAGPRLKAQR